jgi:hypothetical protein
MINTDTMASSSTAKAEPRAAATTPSIFFHDSSAVADTQDTHRATDEARIWK